MSRRFRCACTAVSLALICTCVRAQLPAQVRAPPAAPAPAADHCIVGEAVFGCRSEAAVVELTTVHGDAGEIKDKIAAGVASGECRMFLPGERVFRAGVTADAERAAVRLPDDTVWYWMPASWSRPLQECATYATRRSVREKLGLAATTQANPMAPDRAQAPARLPPPTRPAPASCVIKPVMTDAEIALCRNLDR